MDTRHAGAPGDLTTPETFTTMVKTESVMKRMIPTLVMLFLISALLFGMVLNAVDVPGGFLVGLVVALAFCALMWLLKKRQLDEALGQRTVTFSPSGAVMSDRDTRVELPWPRVRSIGEVELMRAVKTPTTSPLSAIGSGVVRGTQDAMLGTHEQGLVGAGLLTVNPGAAMLVKTQVKQFLNGGPADPQIGQRPMGIPLVQFETDWQNGRIGQWVRAYRPDLLG